MTKENRMMAFAGDVRCLAEWRFEGGAFVAIMVSGDVATEKAIEWIERMLQIKKDELKAAQPNDESDPPNPQHPA